MIVEPSAGNGSFIKPLKRIKCSKVFIDIAPESNLVTKADFFSWQPLIIAGKVHVIGNPPFGKNSSLCLKFVKRASKIADSFGFILPLSFKKQSLVSKIPKNFHLISESLVVRNGFILGDLDFNLPTVFQVWQKQEMSRVEPVKNYAKGFTFVNQATANVAITRVGAGAGSVKLNHEISLLELSRTTHWFIKVDNNLSNLLHNTRQLECESMNWVVGPKSISKPELILLLNRLQTMDVYQSKLRKC